MNIPDNQTEGERPMGQVSSHKLFKIFTAHEHTREVATGSLSFARYFLRIGLKLFNEFQTEASYAEKLEILKKMDQDSALSGVGREFGISKTTMMDIKKAKEKIISLLHAEAQGCKQLPGKEGV